MVQLPAPEWVRRAGQRELSAYVVGGVPVMAELPRLGRLGRLMVRLGILADDATSAELSRLDAELDAIEAFRRSHQAHPMDRALDGDWDALADTVWSDTVWTDPREGAPIG